jgi:predicted transcriptional regulator
MDMSEERRDDGAFAETVSDQDVLFVFDAADEPILTAGEIAEALPVGPDAVYRRLRAMHEEGLVGRKKVGARAVAWWAEVAPRLDEDVARAIEEQMEDGGVATVSQAAMKERLGIED